MGISQISGQIRPQIRTSLVNDPLSSGIKVVPLLCSRCGQMLGRFRVTTSSEKVQEGLPIVCGECKANGWKVVSYQHGFGVMLVKGTPQPAEV